MKNIFLPLLLFSTSQIMAQQLSGKLENSTESSVTIRYSSDGITNSEKTISLNDKGEFSFQVQLQNPVIARLVLTNEIWQEIFLAPGLGLNLKADVANKENYSSTLRFSGTAARYNQFFLSLHSNSYYRSLDHNNFLSTYREMPANEKITLRKKYKHTRDSLRHNFFQKFKGDKLANKFEAADSVETQYDVLVSLRLIHDNEIAKDDKLAFWEKNITPFMKESDDPVILSGYNYKFMWMLYSHTLYFRAKSAGDTSRYTSKIEFERYWSYADRLIKSKKLVEAVYATHFFPSLASKYKEASEKDFPEIDSVFERMLSRINSAKLAEELRIKNNVSKELARLNRNGKPAVVFQLFDSSGKTYGLTDFTNRVLVLDLWASWCAPCIEEFPHMRKLQEKFKEGIDVKFVAVSLDQFRSHWLEKGVYKFSPPGLQLWAGDGDRRSDFYINYFSNGIPHFVIIDKKGFYYQYEAPYPSDGDKLEKLIVEAINK